MIVVKQFGVELDAVNASPFLLHGLDLTGLVGGGLLESFGQLLHLVTVRMPDSHLRRQSFEQAFARMLDWRESALAFAPSYPSPGSSRSIVQLQIRMPELSGARRRRVG